jgi:DNA repair protein RecO (recombination protein O)
MPLINDEAIAIRRLDFSESSQVLIFFTREHGKQRLIAKGVKRSTKTRFATGIDLLERGEVVFSRREERADRLGIMTEWHQEDVFAELRNDLRWIYAAQYAAEVTDAGTEDGDPSPGLYDALVTLLQSLSRDGLPALVRFQRAVLEEIGLMPDLTRCVVCGRSWSGKTEPWFSARQGGLVCRSCEGGLAEKRRVQSAAVLSITTDDLTDGSAGKAFDLLDYHLTESLGHELRLSRHLRAMMH